ncbi:MAG: nicotinate phosphoribosyltransferase [Methanobrevibacter sp.]|nr:nicotinate phosphoribosyltransferase [Methanobrevibacter sp.]
MIDNNNICLMSDSYKFTHHQFYPEDTEYVYSYLESRNGAQFNRTVFFGLQYILKKYLEGQVVSEDKIEIAKNIIDEHIGPGIFNEEGWYHILEKCDGKLPVEIKAVKEGTPVEVSNVLLTVVNTDRKCFWLTNYLESLLLQVWYPSTVATLTRESKKLLNFYLDVTGSDKSNLDFMLHDFGFRGASSYESSQLAGVAHLINFSGTDTVPALLMPLNYYNHDLNNKNYNDFKDKILGNLANITGYSVQATEHSVMTSLGEDLENNTIKTILANAKNGVLSIVIDSYNYQEFINKIGKILRNEVDTFLNKADGNKIVLRPDSGDPVTTTLDCLNLIDSYFSSSFNEKGYKELPPEIGVLWGDGIDYKQMRDILFAMKNNKWAASNIVFGMGGGIHSSVNRDTQRKAFKSSAQYRSGKWYDIYKKPLDVTKTSKKGKFSLIKENGSFLTIPLNKLGDKKDYLETVFKNGEIKRFMDFEEIRGLAKLKEN